MMKTLGLLPRRADWPRRHFRDYYESRHTPLALCYFPFEKYIRNHLLDHDDIGFDTISEFWAENVAELAALMEGPVGDLMREDERRFMHRPHIRSAVAHEKLLSGPTRDLEEIDRLRFALLLRKPENVAADAFTNAAEDWGRRLAADNRRTVVRVAIDVLQVWGDQDLPFAAVLWIWPEAGTTTPPALTTPDGVTLWKMAKTESLETPERVLVAAARNRAAVKEPP